VGLYGEVLEWNEILHVAIESMAALSGELGLYSYDKYHIHFRIWVARLANCPGVPTTVLSPESATWKQWDEAYYKTDILSWPMPSVKTLRNWKPYAMMRRLGGADHNDMRF